MIKGIWKREKGKKEKIKLKMKGENKGKWIRGLIMGKDYKGKDKKEI